MTVDKKEDYKKVAKELGCHYLFGRWGYQLFPKDPVGNIYKLISIIPLNGWILEKGSYDDYKVDILDVTDCNLKNKEILTLLNCDRWSDYSISGGIIGEVKKCNCLNLLDEATSGINAIFSCYDNREYKTVLDKKYSRDELLKIATSNDNSGLAYWEREIDNKYDTYIECFDIYKKLLKGN